MLMLRFVFNISALFSFTLQLVITHSLFYCKFPTVVQDEHVSKAAGRFCIQSCQQMQHLRAVWLIFFSNLFRSCSASHSLKPSEGTHFNVSAIPRKKETIYGLLFKSFIVFKMWNLLYNWNDQYCKWTFLKMYSFTQNINII